MSVESTLPSAISMYWQFTFPKRQPMWGRMDTVIFSWFETKPSWAKALRHTKSNICEYLDDRIRDSRTYTIQHERISLIDDEELEQYTEDMS